MGWWVCGHEQASLNWCGSYQPKGDFPRLVLMFSKWGRLNVIVAEALADSVATTLQIYVLFLSQIKLEQEKCLLSTWPLKYKWARPASVVNVMMCFVRWLHNVNAFLSWLMHFQPLASSDALTKGKGEEKRVAVLHVESCRAVSPLESCVDPVSTSNHQRCTPVKSQLMVEVPAASFCYVVKFGAVVSEGVMHNSGLTALAFSICCIFHLESSCVHLPSSVCSLAETHSSCCKHELPCTRPPLISPAQPAGKACCNPKCYVYHISFGVSSSLPLAWCSFGVWTNPCSLFVSFFPSKLNHRAKTGMGYVASAERLVTETDCIILGYTTVGWLVLLLFLFCLGLTWWWQ